MRFAAASILALLTTAVPVALSARPMTRAFISTTEDHRDVESCGHFHTTSFTTLGAEVHGEERRLLLLSSVTPLSVTASEAGGISIRGWSRSDARLTVCKFAAAATLIDARNLLESVSVTAALDGRIRPSGPALTSERAWWVHMILEVPRATALELAAANGGIAVSNMAGRIEAKTTNGQISLASCIGEQHVHSVGGGIMVDHAGGSLDARSESGGIAIQSTTGDVWATTVTGDIAISLPGETAGSGRLLDARSESGAVRLHIRDDFNGRIEAEASADGQIECNLARCTDLRADQSPRHLRIGKASPVIRLTTRNSAIRIDEPW
jgi:hypothetical protein